MLEVLAMDCQRIEMVDLFTDPNYSDIRFECDNGKPVKKVRIYMNSRGCRYSKRKECLMCGYFKQANEFLTSREMVLSFQKEFEKYDFGQYPILAVYTPGSFLDDRELLPGAREEILQMIGATNEIKNVIIETRPEFVTREKIKEIVQSLPNKIVTIAMGLESSNDFVRNKCINKSLTWDCYLRAAKTITRYCNLRTYILFKPPFLTESEAIDDAIGSIQDAFSVGSESVFLEICNVQRGSPLESLYDMGLYKPPRLWSVLDVLSRFEGKKVFVGGINDYPPPKAEASNCEFCTENVKRELIRYNSTLDLSPLMELDCECRYVHPLEQSIELITP